MSEKKKKAREQQAAASAPKPEPPLPTPVPIKQTNVIHCDSCTGALLQETVEFEDGNYHPDCLACYSCKTKLRGQTIYQEEKGLACEKCKHTVKCKYLIFLIIIYQTIPILGGTQKSWPEFIYRFKLII